MKKPEYILKKYLSDKVCKKCNGIGTIKERVDLPRSRFLEAIDILDKLGKEKESKYIRDAIDKADKTTNGIVYREPQCECCSGYGKLILWEIKELFDFNQEVYEAADWFVEKVAAETEMNKRNKEIENRS